MTAQVVELAREAKRAGLDGVVASAQEASAIRRVLPKPFLIVCPGIRPANVAASDHQRVVTPGSAVAQGADFLVVGRPITEARNPREAVRVMCQDIQQGVQCAC
jgi:orotidine-5'-phosphate decarboxylase